jgi:hypothetical protein
MGQKVGCAVQTGAAAACDGLPEMLGVAADDDRGKQVESGPAEGLAFGGAVTDLALRPMRRSVSKA